MTSDYIYLDPNNFGEWLKAERRKQGYTRQYFAEIVGVSVMAIYKYEAGYCSPTLKNYVNLIGALGYCSKIGKISEPDDGCRSCVHECSELCNSCNDYEYYELSEDDYV